LGEGGPGKPLGGGPSCAAPLCGSARLRGIGALPPNGGGGFPRNLPRKGRPRGAPAHSKKQAVSVKKMTPFWPPCILGINRVGTIGAQRLRGKRRRGSAPLARPLRGSLQGAAFAAGAPRLRRNGCGGGGSAPCAASCAKPPVGALPASLSCSVFIKIVDDDPR